MVKMKKGFAISLIVLIFSSIFMILIIVSRVFFSIQWIDTIYDYIAPSLSLFFYEYGQYIYGAVLILFMILLLVYVFGYNLAKFKQLTGSIIYLFSLSTMILIIFVMTNYAYFSILFNQKFKLNTRLMFILLLLPVNFAFSLILFIVNLDFSIFLKDLIKARKVWKHNRPKFDIDVKDKMTYINIETEEFVFTPVPMLIVAKYLQSKGHSISWFVRGAFNHLLSLIISYLTGWPRARNKLFRFMGMKIGNNCHISEKSHPDPLLPDLIEFEDGSGCGIGVKLLTHDVMNLDHASFGFGPIKVSKNARIGAYSVIMPGVTIGEGSIIGVNSLVTNDIPPYSIAVGTPAKVIRELTDSEKEKINKEY